MLSSFNIANSLCLWRNYTNSLLKKSVVKIVLCCRLFTTSVKAAYTGNYTCFHFSISDKYNNLLMLEHFALSN